MKKIILITMLVGITVAQTKAQFAHFEVRSNPPGWPNFDALWEISAGTRVNAPTAAVVGAYRPGNIPANNNNFYIMETPLPNTSSGFAGRAYKVYLPGTGCSAGGTQLNNSSGITPIEVRQLPTPLSDCAMVGAALEGCFFGLFNRALNTNPMTSPTFFEFPVPATTQPSRPIMVQTNDPNNYEFLIAGEYNQSMYMMKIDGGGNVIWSNMYLTNLPGTPLELYPKSIMIDPYLPNIVTIVGQTRMQVTGYDGFFMQVDIGIGAVTKFVTYSGTTNSKDKFNSVSAATNPAGYIIGGGTDFNSSNMVPWVLKLDMNGNLIWGEIVTSSQDPTATGMLEVLERNNTITPGIEYYGLFESQQKSTVAKLDLNGQPFHIANPATNSEFPYNTFWYGGYPPFPIKPVGMYLDNGPVNGLTTGLNIYGTFYLGVYNQLNLVSSFFNGESTCNTPTLLPSVIPTGVIITQPNVPLAPGLNSCNLINIVPVIHSTNSTYVCVNIYNTTGNNLKPSGSITGVEEFNNGEVFKAYPNPVNDKLIVACLTSDSEPLTIEVFNQLGQRVYEIQDKQPNAGGAYKTEIDFGALRLASGMYVVVAKAGTETHTKKITFVK